MKIDEIKRTINEYDELEQLILALSKYLHSKGFKKYYIDNIESLSFNNNTLQIGSRDRDNDWFDISFPIEWLELEGDELITSVREFEKVEKELQEKKDKEYIIAYKEKKTQERKLQYEKLKQEFENEQ